MTQAVTERPVSVVSPAVGSVRRRRKRTLISAHGQPMVWLSGGSLVIALAMIVGLLSVILLQGAVTFWPRAVVRIETTDGKAHMGEIARHDTYTPSPEALDGLDHADRQRAEQSLVEADGQLVRRLIRTGNFELAGTHFVWVNEFAVNRETEPHWAVTIERESWGRFYGELIGFELDGNAETSDPQAAWELFNTHFGKVHDRRVERRGLELEGIGRLSKKQEQARLEARKAELRHGAGSPQHLAAQQQAEQVRQAAEAESAEIASRIAQLNHENERYKLILRTADGRQTMIPLADVVRAYPANQLGFRGKLAVYGSRWWEFLTAEPREANSEGGVWPAIVGTLVMTMLMSIMVVPLGVLAALYLREYAKAGKIVSMIRIAVNNLAGVPSIVFGVFGLGLFCYIIGGGLDRIFFEHKLPNPTLGKTAMLWASLTLALLTLPVVIVATEEALAAVPNSMREGSYACGASKWQTVRRIVLPRAMPGIMTGMILAVARAAGEVAPLMLVGAVKLAQDLPVDGTFPFFHLDRSFMHLGFHIFDLGFQSPNSEAAKPMVFTTTLLLLTIIFVLNVAAIRIRTRLSRRFTGEKF